MGLQSMWALKDMSQRLGVGGGEKSHLRKHKLSLMGRKQMTKDPAADANPITTNTLSTVERTLYIT